MDNNIKAKTIGTLHQDMYFDRKVSVSFDNLTTDPSADYKVLVQIEPPTIMNLVNQIPQHKDKFDLILAWHPTVLSKCENSELFPFGSCWIDEGDRGLHEKTKTLSIISSNKRQTAGHRLRHEIINSRLTNIDVFGRGYRPIDNKITGLKDYMFSLIIENDNTENWFTEKIIDCLVTGTVPVYWGCNNIGDYFNTNGFIQFKNMEEFKKIIPNLTKETYVNMVPFIEENYRLCLNYVDFWGRLSDIIKKNMTDGK
jgi:hypothetical protein